MSVRTREMNSRSTKTDRRLCGTRGRKFEIDPRLTSHGRTTEIRSRMREIEGRTTEIWTAQGSRSELGLSVVRLRFAVRIVRRCAKVGHGRRLIPYHPYEGEIWQKDENAKIVVPRGNRNNPCIQKQLFTKFKG